MTGILKRLFSKKPSKQSEKREENFFDKARVLSRNEHCVSRKKISNNALKVLYRLNEAGYQAYLVGGGVRDILLGLQPKDFDVTTDATPEQIKTLFRNCRLIGRRFRLAHILFGREVIEVATFRASHEVDDAKKLAEEKPFPKNDRDRLKKHDAFPHKNKNDRAQTSDQGMLTRDNVYGSMLDDAFRRDFTINALYYTVKGFSVIDYTNGLEDLKQRKLRLIGDPAARYREDPVRILRAIRLSCKLNLVMAANTLTPIKKLAHLLTHVSAARLWDECNKMLLAGHAQSTWDSLCDNQVADHLFPQTIACLKNKNQPESCQAFDAFIHSALQSTDQRINKKLPVTPAFLFAVFLWKPQQELAKKLVKKGFPSYDAHQKAASEVMEKQQQAISIPRRFSIVAKEMWALQFRLANLRRKSVHSVITHARFRAAYDFLCLRAGNNSELKRLAKWWTDYQQVDHQQRVAMLNEANSKAKAKPKAKTKSESKPKPKPKNNSPQ